jgi:hypothetical protein
VTALRDSTPPRDRPFCADISRESGEPLAATASRVDRWILVEYRGLWGRDALASSGLSDQVKAHLRERASALAPAKVLFVRRAERRGQGGLCVFWASSDEREPWLAGTEVDAYEDLLELSFERPGDGLAHPLLLACTNGKHDPCCARHGRRLYEALREQAEPGWAWQCTHVGGDRFAGNLVCLPEGLYFGRVGRDEAWPVLDEYLAGRVHLDCYRGRSCHPFAVQAAERAVREETGIREIAGVELVSRRPIRFAAGGRTYEVEVREEAGELTYLTCAAGALRRPRRFVAGTPRERAG